MAFARGSLFVSSLVTLEEGAGAKPTATYVTAIWLLTRVLPPMHLQIRSVSKSLATLCTFQMKVLGVTSHMYNAIVAARKAPLQKGQTKGKLPSCSAQCTLKRSMLLSNSSHC